MVLVSFDARLAVRGRGGVGDKWLAGPPELGRRRVHVLYRPAGSVRYGASQALNGFVAS
jgi:hypothetical protein